MAKEIYTTHLGLNKDVMMDTSYKMREHVNRWYSKVPDGNELTANSSMYSETWVLYNFFIHPYPGVFELYSGLKKTFRNIVNNNEPYYMQSWINFYNKDDVIDWHKHWPGEMKTWHGFYCVNAKNSTTVYRWPPSTEETHVECDDDLLVLNQSNGDIHKTLPWNEDVPRISIAFDIVPAENIDPLIWNNHWMPI